MKSANRLGRMLVAGVIAVSLGTLPGIAAEKKKGEAKKAEVKKGPRERIDCMVGTEDRQARIAIEAYGGKIHNFAWYGKTKPRTCSLDIRRGDAYSKWEDSANHTVVTLVDETGAFVIDQEKSRYHFIFRDIDRMRYCGMHGKLNGSLTVTRGKNTCTVDKLYLELETGEAVEIKAGEEAEKKEGEKKTN